MNSDYLPAIDLAAYDQIRLSGTAKILVVNTNDAERSSTVLVLTQAGYEVMQEAGADEALRIATQFEPDLILLDVNCPDLQGLDVLRQFKSDATLHSSSVILLGVPTDDPDCQSAALDAGATDYIARPVSNPELLARVRLNLRHHALTRSLGASEARFREWITQQPDAFVVLDDSGNILFANGAAETLLGELSATQVGAPLCAPGASTGSVEFNIQRPGRSDIVAELRMAPTHWQGGLAWITPLRDITLRKHAEQARDESEHRFHLLWQTCSNAIVLMDANSIIRYANPALLQVFGHTPAAAVGQSLALLQPRHLAGAHSRGMQRYLETGQRTIDWRSVETVGLHKDGREFPVEIEFSAMVINGEHMFAGFMRDITDRRKAEEAQARLLHILESTLNEVYVFDPESLCFEYVNRAALRNLGYPPEAMQDMTPLDLKPEFIESSFRQLIAPLIRHEQAQQRFESVHRRANGSLYPVEVHLQLVEHKSNRVFLGVVLDVTERKEAEMAQIQSEERLQFVMASAGVGYWDMDITTNVTQRSLLHDRCFGYDELIPQWGYDTFISHVHPADRKRVDARYKAAESGDGDYNVEFRVVWPDGSIHWLHSIGRFTRDQSGHATRVSGVQFEITDRKQAEEAAQKSASLLRQAGKLAQIGGWEINLREQKVNWSDYMYEIFEVPAAAELTPGTMARFYSPESYKIRTQVFADCARDGATFDREFQIVTGKGRTRLLHMVGQPLRDAGGTIVGVQGAAQDVTRLRAADAQMRLLESAVSRLNDIVLITEAEPVNDPGPRIVFVNDAFERRTGYARAEVMGKSPKFLQGPKTQRAELDRIRHALARWQPVRAELINYTKTGEEFCLELEIVPLADETGWYTHWVAIERDVTERRSLEEQLRQSQRLEAVGQLTGGVAHDFNNLLTVILGNAELLSELAGTDQRQRMLAEMIVGAGQRGAQLTQGLLAVARQQPLDPKVVDINLMLGEMESLLRRTLGAHVAIELVRPTALWKTLVDPAQIESAVLNLCINARDAMPAGGKIVIESANISLDQAYIALHPDVQPGPYVCLAISDTGIGIAPEILARVFEPFFTTKEKGKGTGLGLAMVYGFIKQSRGHINVYSELGHGTTVKLYLPQAEGSESMSIGATHYADALGGTETILLTEDDTMVRQFIRGQLAALGYTVIEAEDGRRALEIIGQRADIDLLCTDVVMPGGMNGRQLADEATRVRPGLKVLYTSGYTENAIVHQGRLDPGVLLLSKPYRRADLARKVREALDRN